MKKLIDLSRRPLSAPALILIVAIFMGVFANTSFFANAAKIYLHGEDDISANFAFVVSLFVYVVGLLTITLSVVCHKAFTKPLLIGFLLLSAVIANFTNEYGVVIDHRMIENVLETNAAEAGDLLTWPLVIYVILLGVVPSLFVWKVQLASHSWKRDLFSRAALAGVALAAMAAAFFTFSSHYASMFRMQRALWAQINPTHAIFSAGKLARIALKSRTLPHTIIGADAKPSPNDKVPELVIMVVGETARADHFSLNGYERETNPNLKKENIVNFPDFWACATSTAQAVPCMFSHFTRKEIDTRYAKATDNALDILKRAGVAVLWRDNNSSSKGVADRVTYQSFKSDQVNPVCDTECRDEGMLHGLQEYIDGNSGKDVLIVLHTMGNHGPAYYKRYPKAFEKFTPTCKTSNFGECSQDEIINAYDNVILYTDYVLSKIIEFLKKNDDRYETAMFYVSDHGESLGEKGLFLHGMPWFIAPDEQKHVPAVMWFGRNFNKQYLSKIETRRKERLSHDNIFSTLIGLFEIQTEVYDPEMDILDRSDGHLS